MSFRNIHRDVENAEQADVIGIRLGAVEARNGYGFDRNDLPDFTAHLFTYYFNAHGFEVGYWLPGFRSFHEHPAPRQWDGYFLASPVLAAPRRLNTLASCK